MPDNGLLRCRPVVVADPRKWGYVRPEYRDNLRGVVSLFCGFFRWQLRSPLRGFVGFGPGFVEAHELFLRVNRVGVFGAELGLGAVAALSNIAELEYSRRRWSNGRQESGAVAGKII